MSKQRQKYIAKLSKKEKEKIILVIEKILNGNLERLDVKKLEGFENKYRVRIGTLRIAYENIDGKNYIEYIKPRGDIYKNL